VDNEVVVRVTGENDTKAAFDGARADAKKLHNDIHEAAKKTGPSAGSSLGKGIGSGLLGAIPEIAGVIGKGLGAASESISGLAASPIGKAIGAGAGAVAGTVLMATLSSVVAAGAGLGVIGVGVTAAVKKSPEIQQAGKQAGQRFMDALGREAAVYNKPILEALGTLDAAGQRIAGKLGQAFGATAKSIGPLVDSITSGIEALIDSIAGIASNSGGALEGLGEAFEIVSESVGQALEYIVGNGESAGDSLVVLAGVIGKLIEWAGAAIGSFTVLADTLGFLGPLADLFRDTGDGAKKAATDTKVLTDSMTEAATAATHERDALAKLSDELKAQTDPVFGLLEAQEALKEAQDKTTEAARKYGRNSPEFKGALRDQARAALELESNAGKLGDTFNGKMTPAMRATLRAAGITEKGIADLEKQFRDAKRAGDRFAGTYTANIVTRYSTVGKRNGDFGRGGSYTGVGGLASGGIKGAANGSTSSGLTWVGERGAELIDLPPGTQVHSSGDSDRMMRQGGGLGGSARGGDGGELKVTLVFDPSQAPEAIQGLMKGIRAEIRDGGGSVQTVLGVAGVS
jgi:hypothetical protein